MQRNTRQPSLSRQQLRWSGAVPRQFVGYPFQHMLPKLLGPAISSESDSSVHTEENASHVIGIAITYLDNANKAACEKQMF